MANKVGCEPFANPELMVPTAAGECNDGARKDARVLVSGVVDGNCGEINSEAPATFVLGTGETDRAD